jgi:hypothetical protein
LTIKPGQSLVSLSEENSRAVLMHPAQQEAADTVAQLITWLRTCETPEDCFEFQRYLFRDLHEVQERRGQCSRVLTRLRRGGTATARQSRKGPARCKARNGEANAQASRMTSVSGVRRKSGTTIQKIGHNIHTGTGQYPYSD